ncbi:MAG: hypothetical protein COZ57_16185 [Armatimonadetes bacterium CG_4_8_14_3_um_filter_66_20]|nr:MAG: hypothetical protein COZ57_16185 [Armatimonadetes bacterium CG_4_8_14_3_um_filter_66_20]
MQKCLVLPQLLLKLRIGASRDDDNRSLDAGEVGGAEPAEQFLASRLRLSAGLFSVRLIDRPRALEQLCDRGHGEEARHAVEVLKPISERFVELLEAGTVSTQERLRFRHVDRFRIRAQARARVAPEQPEEPEVVEGMWQVDIDVGEVAAPLARGLQLGGEQGEEVGLPFVHKAAE